MRKIPINYLKPGMKLGKNLYDRHNSLLLAKGNSLDQHTISRIVDYRYQAVFIADHDNDGIEFVEDTEDIPDDIRNNAVSSVKEIFIMENSKFFTKKFMNNINNVLNDIIDEILKNKNATFTMTDLKLFDDYTYYHSVNVTVISIIIGVSIKLNKTKLYELGMGALMHDIGKIFIPKEILLKQGSLTLDEYNLVKDHSSKGFEYLNEMNQFSHDANLVALTHHEKYDGKGYPEGISGFDIPLFGRILAVADVFDALVSDRPYRKAMQPSEAVEYISGESGQHFDPDIVDIFLEKVSPYPVGCYVMLSNGEKAVVVKNQPKYGLRPMVKVINDSSESIYYDLSKENFDITIKSIVY